MRKNTGIEKESDPEPSWRVDHPGMTESERAMVVETSDTPPPWAPMMGTSIEGIKAHYERREMQLRMNFAFLSELDLLPPEPSRQLLFQQPLANVLEDLRLHNLPDAKIAKDAIVPGMEPAPGTARQGDMPKSRKDFKDASVQLQLDELEKGLSELRTAALNNHECLDELTDKLLQQAGALDVKHLNTFFGKKAFSFRDVLNMDDLYSLREPEPLPGLGYQLRRAAKIGGLDALLENAQSKACKIFLRKAACFSHVDTVRFMTSRGANAWGIFEFVKAEENKSKADFQMIRNGVEVIQELLQARKITLTEEQKLEFDRFCQVKLPSIQKDYHRYRTI